MVTDQIARALKPVQDRIAMMLGRCVLKALESSGSGPMKATVVGVAGEVLADREFVQDYGLSSRPHPGAEGLMGFLAGLRSNGVVIRLFDRRYQITLASGEVAIHDDLGQMVHLTRAGIVVSSPTKIRLDAPEIEIHATTSFRFDVNGHGQHWFPAKVDSWTIGAEAGTPHPITPPEIS